MDTDGAVAIWWEAYVFTAYSGGLSSYSDDDDLLIVCDKMYSIHKNDLNFSLEVR